MAKRRCSLLPLFALAVAFGGVLAVVLLRYDRFSHARMLREIDNMRDFFLTFVPMKEVVHD